jgi:isocitrate dehydrogenase (NAD+)
MLANPTALLLSAILMLRHIGETAAATSVTTALHDVLSEHRVRTRDLGGTASTLEFADAVIHRLDGVKSRA